MLKIAKQIIDLFLRLVDRLFRRQKRVGFLPFQLAIELGDRLGVLVEGIVVLTPIVLADAILPLHISRYDVIQTAIVVRSIAVVLVPGLVKLALFLPPDALIGLIVIVVRLVLSVVVILLSIPQ